MTYPGQAHGMTCTSKHMRQRNRGSIVNVDSVLGYRSVPLQSVYCEVKFAIYGFTDSLRSEIIHDTLDISLSMVNLPAVNTPQFDWALNKMGKRPQPVPPVFQPEIPARAIYFAAFHPGRQTWIGFPTVMAIAGNLIVPGLIDPYLAKSGIWDNGPPSRRRPMRRVPCLSPYPGIMAPTGVSTRRRKRPVGRRSPARTAMRCGRPLGWVRLPGCISWPRN